MVYLRHTNNPNEATKKLVEFIALKFPNQKIVVAYNSITECFKIINRFNPEIQVECGMLCSEASEKEAGDYYTELERGKLTTRITFMTCAYFVGVDIDERFHLISVSHDCQDYAMLSVNRIIQIAGRCRKELYSHSVIYNTDEDVEQKDISEYQEVLFQRANAVLDVYDSSNALLSSTPQHQYLNNRIKRGIRRYAVDEMTAIQLTKENIDNQYVISYFNVDAIMERIDLKQILYSDKNLLIEKLEENGFKVRFSEHLMEVGLNQIISENATSKQQKEIRIAQIHAKLDEIVAYSDNNTLDERYFTMQLRRSKRLEKVVLGHIRNLYKYYDMSESASFLKRIDTSDKRTLTFAYNALLFKALPDNHPFKSGMANLFPVNQKVATSGLKNRLNTLLEPFCGKGIVLDSNVKKCLGIFFTYKDRRGEDGYVKISGINSEFVGGINPVDSIPFDCDVAELFDIVWN
jgi:hypothetical protein